MRFLCRRVQAAAFVKATTPSKWPSFTLSTTTRSLQQQQQQYPSAVRCLASTSSLPFLRSSSRYNALHRPFAASFSTTSSRLFPLGSSRRQQPISSTIVIDENRDEGTIEKRAKEINDAKLIFNQAWKNIEDHYGRDRLTFPREFIFLMGAPGSGKGTHTPSILHARGITNPPISMSNLLTSPESQALINKGQMISDRYALEQLFHALLALDPDVGVLVDGFPRTEIQVECLKMIYDKMIELRREFMVTAHRDMFPRPVFRICVLYVDEDISVSRQVRRGMMIKDHNIQVEKTGQGVLIEERVTDSDEMLIRARYQIFKEHYGALLKLSKIFPFHLINAIGTIEEVMHIILKEFEYQSSLELDQETYDSISHIPLAQKIGIHARQDLIRRLEHYQETEPRLLSNAIAFIDKEIIPQVLRHAISGTALVRTANPHLENSHLVDIIMDVLSERGYHVTFDSRVHQVPNRVNLETGEILLHKSHVYALNIRFPQHNIQPLEQKFSGHDYRAGLASPLPFSSTTAASTTS